MSSDENDLFVDHVNHSIGGFGGHAFRRLTHISMACIPYLYYVHGEDISSIFSLEMREFVSVVCILLLVIEAIRLRTGIVIVGQREYESRQISALAWGALAVALALLISPEGEGEGMEAAVCKRAQRKPLRGENGGRGLRCGRDAREAPGEPEG